MSKSNEEVIILLIVSSSAVFLFALDKLIFGPNLLDNVQIEYIWILNGLRNVYGYAIILLPGYLVYKYVYRRNYLDKAGNGYIPSVIRRCFAEDAQLVDQPFASKQDNEAHLPLSQEILRLFTYFIGLQISYLTWGVLQEKVMTQTYRNSNGETGHFTDSQFLVFVNRILAFIMSGIILLYKKQPRDRTPLYKYVFCSLSNILSSWCQYEALKYVSFLHQVLAKAAKIIPVMIMGKIVSKVKYNSYEYLTAIILSIGMLIFMLETDTSKGSSVTTMSGIALLCTYIISDSFTSNWQGALFKKYNNSSLQMMYGVNMFSCLFTVVSLILQGNLAASINFMCKFPHFIFDCVLLSICSATGQLLIFKTIAVFGPLVFTLITTIRQGFAVLLSCLIYHHYISPFGVFGIILVFFSIFVRIYCSYRIKTIKRRRMQALNNSTIKL